MQIKYYASNQQPATSNQQPAKPATSGGVMTSSSAYLRFLNLTHAVNDQLGNADVDLLALRLLEAIAIADAKGTHLTVTEAMSLREIASPATMHRKLNTLLDAGLILQTYEGKNRRTKYLVPTASAAKHFEQLGKAMLSALHTN